jgi:ribose 5-phosphate isomerase B
MDNLIVIGSDHAGFLVKEYIKDQLSKDGYVFKDFGCDSEESVDYPDFIHPLAKAINDGDYKTGIIICGTGNGVSMVANKYPNVRAGLCWNEDITKFAREHNDANIIALPARFISKEDALRFVKLFLITSFEGGRHQRRVDKIKMILK